ncbi:MAG: Mannose-1-phosphate guanylyltransferase [Nitrospira sp.]|jgi:mannose-1-phosphate guanylyltransferase|nr:Mannose-1-phosphate guanylyltransferase [Nitrospira sp.]
MTGWNGGGDVWSIVLAGGEGERMKPLVQRWLGRHRPKQYCTFVGTRSMFQHTVDRAADVTGFGKTVVVAGRTHEPEVRAQLIGRSVEKVLWQPANSDTATGVFLPLTYVRAHDPDATSCSSPRIILCIPRRAF